MFGYVYRDKEEKKLAKHDAKNQKKEMKAQNKYVDKAAGKAFKERTKARQQGANYAQEVLNRNVTGLDPKKRQAMQYEADMQVKRGLQSANRKLLGDQGARGIRGGSGVAYAQQRDLQKVGLEAQGQANRDLDKLDSDLALKKMAAMFNIEQGEAAQSGLDRQLALDELRLADERRRGRSYENQYNRSLSRL